MKKEYFTYNPSQTKKLAEILAKKILKIRPKNKAFIIGLEGDLGGGKTTFLQGFAKGLGIKEKILSPTFVIFKKFKITKRKNKKQKIKSPLFAHSKNAKMQKFKNFYHVDCYRIRGSKEILNLGFKEIISNPENIVAIEWAEHIKKIIPKGAFWIKFKFIDKKTRKIKIMC